MTRKTSFYVAFLALPSNKRKAVTAVYDVCRAIDDSVDLEPDPVRAAAALDGWRREIARLFQGNSPETEQGRQLQPFIAPFHLPREQFEALIDGVAMDVTPRRYSTFADLEIYCHRVASAVGLICAEIFGYHDAGVADYARDLGVALQLTNILRDVAVDAKQRRVYVPLEDFQRFGCTEAELQSEVDRGGPGVQSDRIRRLLEHQATRARVFFSRATRALPRDDAPRFLAAEIMRAVYADLLSRIEASGFDIFSHVIRVPRPVQARLAAATWWRLH